MLHRYVFVIRNFNDNDYGGGWVGGERTYINKCIKLGYFDNRGRAETQRFVFRF